MFNPRLKSQATFSWQFKCVKAGIYDQKYILKSIEWENVQRRIFLQMVNIYICKNDFFQFLKLFKLNRYVLVYYDRHLLNSC